MTEAWALAIWGLCGGAAGEFIGYRNETKKQPQLKLADVASNFTLACSAGMAIIAGLITYLYAADGSVTASLAAFNIGLSAPIILGATAGKKQQIADIPEPTT